jgi:hypothetical protein
MLDSLSEEPMSRTDKIIAPIANQIPDQYKPEATGDALRNPNKRESELIIIHSFMKSFVSAYGDAAMHSTGF